MATRAMATRTMATLTSRMATLTCSAGGRTSYSGPHTLTYHCYTHRRWLYLLLIRFARGHTPLCGPRYPRTRGYGNSAPRPPPRRPDHSGAIVPLPPATRLPIAMPPPRRARPSYLSPNLGPGPSPDPNSDPSPSPDPNYDPSPGPSPGLIPTQARAAIRHQGAPLAQREQVRPRRCNRATLQPYLCAPVCNLIEARLQP